MAEFNVDDFPLHKRMTERKTEHRAIEDFLHWLSDESDYSIIEYDEDGFEKSQPPRLSTVIAGYFEIDEAEFSREKDRMLELLRQ